jgi:hypothetical protein
VFATVATGPAIVFAFCGSVGRGAGTVASSQVGELFRESGDGRECHDKFSIAGGKLFGESRVCAG